MMSEQRNDNPMTAGDVFFLVACVGILLLLLSAIDSCKARSRYLDLRDRLERLEQRR